MAASGFVLARLGWAVLAMATGALLFCLWLALGPHGRRRLGPPEARPEFGTLSWLAMLFAAGMGTGLVVWGVAEPVTHALHPPGGGGVSEASARQAMVLTFLHWGLHAWAIYALAALVVGWFAFRAGRPATVSAALAGLGTGGPARGLRWAAEIAGILAVVFGLAGTLAMGARTVASGLPAVGLPPAAAEALGPLVLLAIGLTALASAATPLGRGIRLLSDLNILLAIILMLAVFLLGPSAELLARLGQGIRDYLAALPRLSVSLAPAPAAQAWARDWTLTYFLWWLAWGPFVGVFIARISRGRSIREFLAGVVLVPAFGSFLWFAVLGGSGLALLLADPEGPIARAAAGEPTAALFTLLAGLPAGALLSALALVLLGLFLVTSIDSAAYVLGMMASGGDPSPPVWLRLSWGLLLLLLGAAILSVATVEVARGLAILGALPYPLVLGAQAAGLVLALRSAEGDGKA